MRLGARKPFLRVEHGAVFHTIEHAVATPPVARLRYNAGIVTAACQHEADGGRGEHVDLVDRLPRRDMVAFGSYDEHRFAQRRQGNSPAVDLVFAFGQIIIEKQTAQILAVHGIRHARAVGVPRHEIVHGRTLAHQIFGEDPRPDEIVRTQNLERTAHLAAVEIAPAPHHVLEQIELGLIDEKAKFSGFAELGLGREQGDARQPVVAIARHCGCGDGQQCAPETITQRVDMRVAADRVDGIDRCHRAQPSIGVHVEVAVGAARIVPGDGEDRVTLAHQPADQRIVRRKIENIIFHDPGGHDQHRLRMDHPARRFILDQFDQFVAIDDLSWRRGNSLANRERLNSRR